MIYDHLSFVCDLRPSLVFVYSLDFEQECRRICTGFQADVNKGVGQVLSDMFGINSPEWEQSSGLLVSFISILLKKLYALY